MSKREFPRLQGQRLAAPIRIVIAPTESGRKWVSSLNDKLCISASPLVMASQLLIAERFYPNSIIEMWHHHADAWALRGRLGAVAALIIDGEKKPTQPAKNGPPVQFSGEPNVERAAKLSGLSEDSLKRHHRGKIKQLSPRRLGMRVRDALMLDDDE